MKKILLFALPLVLASCAHDESEKMNSQKSKLDSLRITTDSLESYIQAIAPIHISDTPEMELKLKNLKKGNDDIFRFTTYEHPEQPKKTSSVDIYIVRYNTDSLEGRLRIGYSGNWSYITNCVFLCDGQRYEFAPREFAPANGYEFSDNGINPGLKSTLFAVISAKKVKLTCISDDSSKDRMLSKNELARLKEMYNMIY